MKKLVRLVLSLSLALGGVGMAASASAEPAEAVPFASCTYNLNVGYWQVSVTGVQCISGRVGPVAYYYRSDTDPRLYNVKGPAIGYGTSYVNRPSGTLYGGGGVFYA